VYEEGLRNCMPRSKEVSHSWHKIQAGLGISNTTVLIDTIHIAASNHLNYQTSSACNLNKLVIKDTLYGRKFLDDIDSSQ